MRKALIIILTLSSLAFTANAQDSPFGAFKLEDLNMKQYNKDTSAHAVVLMEHGRAEIRPTNDDDIDLIYEYHEKIKIFDKAGFGEGEIEIPYYFDSDQNYEHVNEIKGTTTYIDESGNVKTIALDPSKIYTVKDNKHWSTIKFAMPGLHNGCIIEYKYTITSPFIEKFHSWEFQSDIPKIYSEYDVHIPAYWNYNASIVGGLKLTKNIAEAEKECFSFRGAKCDCSHFTYGMSDIPALVSEDYMTSRKNFLSAINFELSDYTMLTTGANIKVAKEWKDVDYELKHSDYFGSELKRQSLLKDRIAPVIAGKTDDLDKANAIYEYIRKTIKWNDIYSFESENIRKALDNHTGDVGDINLTLITALNAAGINTEAVILSTREHGTINKLYPIITGFNYVIAKVNIGDKSYLLDATDPLLPFGMLPLRCLNDQGRVMSLGKPSYWIDLTNIPQKETDIYTLDLTLQPDGKIKGTMAHYSRDYAGYEKRTAIKKFNSTDEYVENLDEKSSDFKVLKSNISNLDSLDKILGENYEVEIKGYDNMDRARLAFNPVIIDKKTINPFRLQERSYPVDWGMPSVTRYTVVVHLPENYTVEAPLTETGLQLPNKGGSFVTSFTSMGNSFTYSNVIQLNKSIYSPEEYPYLKEFFNKIILAEKSQLILKKKL